MGLAGEFVEPYGLDVQPPLENAPFPLHDAGHRRGNIPATIYGELLQNVHDHAAFDKLYGSGAIHGSPPSYREGVSGEAGDARPSSFVNYGGMEDKNHFDQRRDRAVSMGATPDDFEAGGEYGWDAAVAQKITAQQADLSRLMKVAEDRFSKGDYTFFQGAGGYDPAQGFMPSVDLRNTREVSPEDVNTARTRGEDFATALRKGYDDAVAKGQYRPQRGVTDGMIHAADLSDAAMQGQVNVGRGWADEEFFPYKDRVGALSNPPARIAPRVLESPAALRQVLDQAAEARSARDLSRLTGAVRTGATATTDIAGSVPLFDPEFRNAVETGNVRKAGEQVAKEYLAGTLAAPLVGLGTGTLQRMAPQVASKALPIAAGAVRTANPVAVVSQLGGSSKPSRRQVAVERHQDPGAFGAQGPSADPQLLRAEAARRRGGRWKIGGFTVPDLGISEAGGLFFR